MINKPLSVMVRIVGSHVVLLHRNGKWWVPSAVLSADYPESALSKDGNYVHLTEFIRELLIYYINSPDDVSDTICNLVHATGAALSERLEDVASAVAAVSEHPTLTECKLRWQSPQLTLDNLMHLSELCKIPVDSPTFSTDFDIIKQAKILSLISFDAYIDILESNYRA